MKKKERDDQFAAHIPGILQYHQMMLADELRNKLLFEAIKKHITPETSFLDVGAGTGVWAILAAKLGAQRVVAIEIEECLIPFIHKHAQENRVAHKIEIIHANSNDVRIRGKFDVIVSELFGGDALGTETVRSFVNIRNRFLAPGGVLIPQKLTLLSAPIHLDGSLHEIPVGLPLTSEFLRSVKMNYGQHLPLSDRGRIHFLAEPSELVEIDFRSVQEPPPLADLTASWNVCELRNVNAIATFNRSTFSDGVEMDSFNSQSWGVSVNEFVPFDKKSGQLKFQITLDPRQGMWTVSLPGMPEAKPQNYGPVFAFSRLRMAQQMTPHRRFRPARSTAKPDMSQKKKG